MRASRFAQIACVLLALVLGFGSGEKPLHAQAADPPAANQNAAEPSAEQLLKKPTKTLGQIIFGSDWIGLSFYAALALMSLVAMTSALERFVNVRREKFLPASFGKRLREMLIRREDTLENLRELAGGSSPVANILKAGVLRAGRPLPEVEKAMEDAANREVAAARGRNRLLLVSANVAPLVGLLGTVVGMIIAFRIASETGTGKAGPLAEGIYIALLTTAGGLMIAIPCMLLYAWFNGRCEKFFREIEETLGDVVPSFARMEDEAEEVVLKVGGEPAKVEARR